MAATVTLRVVVKDSDLLTLESRIRKLERAHVINVTAKATGVDTTTTGVNNLNTSVQGTTRSVSDLGTAFVSKIKWGLIQSSIRAVVSAFTAAVENMKEVDTQITNIAKVTGQSLDSLKTLSNKAY